MEESIQASWNIISERLSSWLEITITNLPNAIIAASVFFLAFWISQRMKSWLNRPLSKFIKQESIKNLISTVLSVLVVALGLFLALGILNLDTVLKSLLAGAGVAGLAIGLALQGTLANTFSGIYLAIKDVMNIGDFVQTNGYSGTITDINLRNVTLKEPDNNIVIIPNKLVVENPFKNFGLTKRIRTTIECGVGYESDLEKVKSLSIKAIEDAFAQNKNESVEFHYKEFGGSSINFQIRFWVDAKGKLSLLEAKSKAIMIIKKLYDSHSINIPFPIRTLQMDSTIENSLIKSIRTNSISN